MGFSLSSKAIVSEVIDGEAIIINMQSGAYFSTEGVGSAIWTAALAGWNRQAIIRKALEVYASVGDVGADVDAFLDLLVTNGLLVEVDSPGGNVGMSDWPSGAYMRPQLDHHSDMQDLIKLDPIHDVDTMGWPTRREDTPAPPIE